MEFSEIEKHTVDLEKTVKSWVRDKQISEDIVQETLLKAWRGKSRFRGDSSVYTWLCSIASNEYKKYKRDSKKETAPLEFDISDNTTPEKEMEAEQIGFDLLSDKERQCLEYYTDGFSTEEIADKVNSTPSSVYVMISHGKRKLHKGTRHTSGDG